MTDEALIQGCLKQDSRFQKKLLDKYSGSLFTICLRYLGDKHIAQDVLQESFVKIFTSLEKFDKSKGGFYSWIHKITVNTCLNHLVSKKIKFSSINQEQVNQLEYKDNIESSLSVDELLLEIQKLPPDLRIVFNLHVIEGYKHSEISETIGIKASSSRARLTKAKKILRSQLFAIKPRQLWMN